MVTVIRKNVLGFHEEECVMEEKLLIGQKSGCLTVIAGPEVYQREVIDARVEKLLEEKERFLRGEKVETNNFTEAKTYDEWISKMRNTNVYKCKCKCGKEEFFGATFFLRKKHRICSDDCGLLEERAKKLLASYPREKDKSYDYPLLNTFHDTLEIIACVNDNYEGEPSVYHKGRLGAGRVPVYKMYRCRCFLCGKEYEYRSDKFNIYNPVYGPYAKFGYQCEAYCECREDSVSSFQWRTTQILKENGMSFRAEWSFDDLYGIGGVNLLRFDFVVFNPDKSIKCLIECQGQQHSEPTYKYGGRKGFERQQANDELKRNYALKHGYQLIEMPYTINGYEKEVEFLKKNNVI